jgi:hypothetical protein
MESQYFIRSEAEPLHRTAAQVLGDDIDMREEPQEKVSAAGRFQVESQALLAKVCAHVGRAYQAAVSVLDSRTSATGAVTSVRYLYLDDLRTEPTEQLGRVGKRLHEFHTEDPDAVKRPH